MCQSPNPYPRTRRLLSQPLYHLLLCRLNENSTRLLRLWDCCLPQTKLCARALLKHAKELSRRNLPRPNGRQRTTCLLRTKISPRHTSAMPSTMMMVKLLVLHP